MFPSLPMRNNFKLSKIPLESLRKKINTWLSAGCTFSAGGHLGRVSIKYNAFATICGGVHTLHLDTCTQCFRFTNIPTPLK